MPAALCTRRPSFAVVVCNEMWESSLIGGVQDGCRGGQGHGCELATAGHTCSIIDPTCRDSQAGQGHGKDDLDGAVRVSATACARLPANDWTWDWKCGSRSMFLAFTALVEADEYLTYLRYRAV